jgi:hypothetical protein
MQSMGEEPATVGDKFGDNALSSLRGPRRKPGDEAIQKTPETAWIATLRSQ